MPIIEHRSVPRLKSESMWLRKYHKNVTSKNGQDGIFEKIFDIIGSGQKWCVEFGARDGITGSNTWNLINNHNWSGVLIEGNEKDHRKLVDNYRNNARVHPVHAFVASSGEQSLDTILSRTPIPTDFDLCGIDIDGNDWHMWAGLTNYKPRVVCIEFNHTVPNDVYFVQDDDPDVNQSCSLLALIELGKSKGYELVATTSWDGIFVRSEYFHMFGIKDNSIDAMWSPGKRETKMFQCCDGTIYTAGLQELMWFKIPFRPDELQVLPESMRHYHNEMSIVKRAQKTTEKFSSVFRRDKFPRAAE
ncbi:hypothetical protein [Labrys wisconsinensis]|uniref:Methyltransferase FkbM domain-containing protein n=1 Tax=Labrys wisconsinensis TaxID=425677 RepID=A0ABU0JHS9_9HYPH|nr:hypothetical protein [Labrys wisconsinensis]MDQ0473840.1 hypothetical protein [Labrys wisconsinensis]